MTKFLLALLKNSHTKFYDIISKIVEKKLEKHPSHKRTFFLGGVEIVRTYAQRVLGCNVALKFSHGKPKCFALQFGPILLGNWITFPLLECSKRYLGAVGT